MFLFARTAKHYHGYFQILRIGWQNSQLENILGIPFHIPQKENTSKV
jgi:hypothetical protein